MSGFLFSIWTYHGESVSHDATMGAHTLAVAANWLAYSATLTPHEISDACEPCARDLARDGIDSVELPIAHMDANWMELKPDFFNLIRKPFAGRKIAIVSVHGPVLSFDRFPLEEEKERIRAYARAAIQLGARSLVVHPVLHANLHVCSIAKQALKRDIALAEAACLELRGSQCRLAIENVPHNSWSYLLELFSHLPPDAGMCFDTGHYWVRPERHLEPLLEQLAPRIACFHINDNHGLCDEHLPPGDGSFPWPTFTNLINQVAPAAPRIIELSLPPLAEFQDAADRTRSAILDARQKAALLV